MDSLDDRAVIARDSAQSQQAGFFIDESFYSGGGISVSEEKEHDFGVARSASGPHGETFERGEAHGGVDASAVFNGAYALTVTQMAGDDFKFLYVMPRISAALRDDIYGSCRGSRIS
jgi:hypothetical protein